MSDQPDPERCPMCGHLTLEPLLAETIRRMHTFRLGPWHTISRAEAPAGHEWGQP